MSSCSTTTTPNVLNANRPVTSKPRGVCRYYTTSRGCYAGDRCKFLHGQSERLTPYDKSKICRFYASGWCRHGDNCWFIHAQPDKVGSSDNLTMDKGGEDEILCSICYDKPVTFGLLVGCSHVFCLPCIKNWRGSEGKSADMVEAGTTKTCPMCRTSSRFVTPSTLFYAEEDPKKAETIEKYKASMARIKCKYFEDSPASQRFCPFGKECFYKHENEDGTPYTFGRGAEHYMRRRRSWREHDENEFITWERNGETGFEAMLTQITRVLSNAHMISRGIRRAALMIGADTVLRLGEDSNADDEEYPATLSSPPSTDTEQPSHPWGDWHSADVNEAPPPEYENGTDISRSLYSHSLPTPSTAQSSAGVTLDPNSPVFVASYLDSLRPLPPGPSGSSEPDLDNDNMDSDPVVDRSSTSLGPSLNAEGLMRDWAERQHIEGEPSRASDPVVSESSSLASLAPAELDARTEVAEHDSDPPFMTDGRGRVVWSSTTLSRGREGRRGRATSSSAIIVPHTKSAPDLSAAEESSDDVLQHEPLGRRPSSLSGRLVRQRSLPLVGSSADAVRSAEFVTDGRGRVVFASNNR